MTDEPVKKTSELLVEMDRKLDYILGIVKNQDVLLKILNNKIGKNSQIPTTSIPVTTPAIEVPNTPKEELPRKTIPGLKPGVVLGPSGLEFRPELVSVSDNEFPQIDTEASSGKKIAVQQKVTYSDGKNICLASVEITGNKLNAPKKLKTNAMGKWMAVLEPGEYVVSVNKGGGKNKQNIAISASFVIAESDRPIELPALSE